MATPSSEYPILAFETPELWEAWLKDHHQTASGIWLRLYKKNSDIKTVSYVDAVIVALCYGWIDSVKHSYDEASSLQKFSPRKSKSLWSQINVERIKSLIKDKRMQPAGMKLVTEAQEDGRWDAAYSSPSNAKVPNDFLAELAKFPTAKKNFEALNKSNLYAIIWRLETAKKPETRLKRLHAIIAMLDKGEKFH